jgi:dihydroorotate dehydrogenase electron transfer subunit
MRTLTARVVSNNLIHVGHFHLVLESPVVAKKSKPGQFVMIRGWKTTQPVFNRPFSIHRINKNCVEILYRVQGEATRQIANLKKNDLITLIGPLGQGFRLVKKTSVLIVAGGIGIAPLVFLSEILARLSNNIAVLIGARTKKEVFCCLQLKGLGCKIIRCTEDGSLGKKCLVTNGLEAYLEKNSPSVIYACGPTDMLKKVSSLASSKNIPCYISLETIMGCGIGTCMGCAAEGENGYLLVCKDGPVFNAEQIVWK